MTINSFNVIQTNTTINNQNKLQDINIEQPSKTDKSNSDFIFGGVEKFNYLFGGVESITNDSKLSNDLINHFSNMSMEEFGIILISFLDKNRDTDKLEPIVNSKVKEVIQSKETAISYFDSQITRLSDSEQQFGDDGSFAKKVFQDISKIFQDNLMKQQQEQYITLGQSQNNNG